MSIDSHTPDKDEIDKDVGIIEDPDNNKKYVKIYRIEASREFILLMFVIVALLAVSLYNPYQLLLVSKENVNNTNRIIDNQESNWIAVKKFIDDQEHSRISSGADLVKLVLLFQLDQERDVGKIMKYFNISNTHFVDLNKTHYITEKGAFPLPYNLSFSDLFNTSGLAS